MHYAASVEQQCKATAETYVDGMRQEAKAAIDEEVRRVAAQAELLHATKVSQLTAEAREVYERERREQESARAYAHRLEQELEQMRNVANQVCAGMEAEGLNMTKEATSRINELLHKQQYAEKVIAQQAEYVEERERSSKHKRRRN